MLSNSCHLILHLFFSTNMYLPFQLSVLCLSCINAVIVTLCEMSKYSAIRQVVTVGFLLKSRCSFQTSGCLLVVKIGLQNSEASKNHFPPSRATPQLSLNKTLSTQLSPSWTNTCVCRYLSSPQGNICLSGCYQLFHLLTLNELLQCGSVDGVCWPVRQPTTLAQTEKGFVSSLKPNITDHWGLGLILTKRHSSYI